MKRFFPIAFFLCFFAGAALADQPAYRMIAPDGFVWPKTAEPKRFLGGKNEMIDLDGDGVEERIVCNDASGSGGPNWQLERRDKDGTWQRINDFFGWGVLAEPGENGIVRLKLTTRCGWSERFFSLYEFVEGKFVCVRIESTDYKNKSLKILHGRLPRKDDSVSATLYRIERRIRRALEVKEAEDYDLSITSDDARTVFFWQDQNRPENKFRIVADFDPDPESPSLFYGCEKPFSLQAEWGKDLEPDLKSRLERILEGTFSLIVSVQSECRGDTELTIEMDEAPFVQRRFSNGKNMPKDRVCVFPTFLAYGRHSIRATDEHGTRLDDSFTLDPKIPSFGVLFFERSPWYEFWEKNKLWFRLRRDGDSLK